MSYLGYQKPGTPRATAHPTSIDLGWAAGFLEGEGSFSSNQHKSPWVEASQVNRSPLLKLKRLFGGRIRRCRNDRAFANGRKIWRWQVSGPRARGVMLTLY